jgi:hypothetical protein
MVEEHALKMAKIQTMEAQISSKTHRITKDQLLIPHLSKIRGNVVEINKMTEIEISKIDKDLEILIQNKTVFWILHWLLA